MFKSDGGRFRILLQALEYSISIKQSDFASISHLQQKSLGRNLSSCFYAGLCPAPRPLELILRESHQVVFAAVWALGLNELWPTGQINWLLSLILVVGSWVGGEHESRS